MRSRRLVQGVAEDVPGKFQLPANALRLGYELLGGQAGKAACQVVLTSMADYLVVSAKTTGSPSHSLSIRGGSWVTSTLPICTTITQGTPQKTNSTDRHTRSKITFLQIT